MSKRKVKRQFSFNSEGHWKTGGKDAETIQFTLPFKEALHVCTAIMNTFIDDEDAAGVQIVGYNKLSKKAGEYAHFIVYAVYDQDEG